jgi:hypothetical protein
VLEGKLIDLGVYGGISCLALWGSLRRPLVPSCNLAEASVLDTLEGSERSFGNRLCIASTWCSACEAASNQCQAFRWLELPQLYCSTVSATIGS